MLYQAYQAYSPFLLSYFTRFRNNTTLVKRGLQSFNVFYALKTKTENFTELSFFPLYELTTCVITLFSRIVLSFELVTIHDTNTNDDRFNLLEKSALILQVNITLAFALGYAT